jgi:hypothetical protein
LRGLRSEDRKLDNDKPTNVGGIITTDPLLNAPIGTNLHITPSLFQALPPPGLNSIANWDYFRGTVLAIHFGGPEGQHILGSGILVAPGVVLAARHVVEPQRERLMAGDLEILCTGIVAGALVIWTCHQVTLIRNADIALLMVRSASALPAVLHQATLTTRMPRVGERLVIAGIRHHADEPTPINTTAELAISMMVAPGTVTARYEHGRDRVLLPGPCFEMDCPAIGGMSGGPAFDEEGFLIGMVTSSIEGDLAGPTFVSLLWPCFGEEINPSWPQGLYQGPTSLLQMDRRLCGLQRPEAIEISVDTSTGQRICNYHHWD